MNRLNDAMNMNGRPTNTTVPKQALIRTGRGMNSARTPPSGKGDGRQPLRHHPHEREDLAAHVLRHGELHHRHDEHVEECVGETRD